jgi:hypothetical protein
MQHAHALPLGGHARQLEVRGAAQRRALNLRRALCCVGLAVICRLGASSEGTGYVAAGGAEPAVTRERLANRRQLLASVAASAATASGPANAITVTTEKTEIVQAPVNPRAGTRSYLFEKPAGFKRYANPGDPSGFVFRSVSDSYFTFVTRAELRANASTEFSPQDFINDYSSKFVNATGSSFTLIKGGGQPDRIDDGLGVKYYEVEYVVRTQLGFTFDTLRSLHFITVFAAAKEGIYVLNCQAPDEEWETDGPILKKIAQSFAVTS